MSSRRGLDADDPEWQEAEKKLDRAWYNMGEGNMLIYFVYYTNCSLFYVFFNFRYVAN